ARLRAGAGRRVDVDGGQREPRRPGLAGRADRCCPGAFMGGGGRVNTEQIRSAERALSAGTWLIVAGAMLYSILTVTPLAARHTPDKWDWTAPILPLVVDAAVVIVVRLDAVLARLGGNGGKWPVVLRWMTGCMTLALNVADSALKNDLVGRAV